MMASMIRFFLALLLMSAPAMAQEITTVTESPPPVAAAPPPVVLELFTSQGCAFCPPADQLMGQLAQQQSVIGLSCHVDYFGVRKNSLGKSFCTKRQSDYNRLIGTGPRYTPQLVINGHMDMIGYEGGKISAGILKGRAEKVKPVAITQGDLNSYNFSLPEIAAGGDPVQLWMAIYDAPKSIAITEGSNLGKKITYFNVVSQMKDLGPWNGQPVTQSVAAALGPENNGIAIIAQDTKTGHILAAGSLAKTLPPAPLASAQ